MSEIFEIIKDDNEPVKIKTEKAKKQRKPISETRKSQLIQQLKDARERKRLLREPKKETEEPKKEPIKVVEPVKEPIKVAEPVKEPIKVAEPVKEPIKVAEPVIVKKEPVVIVKKVIQKEPEFNRGIVSKPIDIPTPVPIIPVCNLFTGNKQLGFWIH
jgi:hypothetical protein